MLVKSANQTFKKVHIIVYVIFSDLPGAIMLNKLKWQTHLHCKVVVFLLNYWKQIKYTLAVGMVSGVKLIRYSLLNVIFVFCSNVTNLYDVSTKKFLTLRAAFFLIPSGINSFWNRIAIPKYENAFQARTFPLCT